MHYSKIIYFQLKKLNLRGLGNTMAELKCGSRSPCFKFIAVSNVLHGILKQHRTREKALPDSSGGMLRIAPLETPQKRTVACSEALRSHSRQYRVSFPCRICMRFSSFIQESTQRSRGVVDGWRQQLSAVWQGTLS